MRRFCKTMQSLDWPSRHQHESAEGNLASIPASGRAAQDCGEGRPTPGADHFERHFDTPTTIPQVRQTNLQLAVQGQLVPQDPNDEPIDDLISRVRNARSEFEKTSSARQRGEQREGGAKEGEQRKGSKGTHGKGSKGRSKGTHVNAG